MLSPFFNNDSFIIIIISLFLKMLDNKSLLKVTLNFQNCHHTFLKMIIKKLLLKSELYFML